MAAQNGQQARIYRHVTPTHPSLQTDVPGHKLSRVDQDEQSEILRVPVAMAITKLLLTLPESTLHAHLPRYSTTVPSCSTFENWSHARSLCMQEFSFYISLSQPFWSLQVPSYLLHCITREPLAPRPSFQAANKTWDRIPRLASLCSLSVH